jgi:hypothetical protein
LGIIRYRRVREEYVWNQGVQLGQEFWPNHSWTEAFHSSGRRSHVRRFVKNGGEIAQRLLHRLVSRPPVTESEWMQTGNR